MGLAIGFNKKIYLKRKEMEVLDRKIKILFYSHDFLTVK